MRVSNIVQMSKIIPFLQENKFKSPFTYEDKKDLRYLLPLYENSFFFETRDKIFYRFNTPPFGFTSEPGKG